MIETTRVGERRGPDYRSVTNRERHIDADATAGRRAQRPLLDDWRHVANRDRNLARARASIRRVSRLRLQPQRRRVVEVGGALSPRSQLPGRFLVSQVRRQDAEELTGAVPQSTGGDIWLVRQRAGQDVQDLILVQKPEEGAGREAVQVASCCPSFPDMPSGVDSQDADVIGHLLQSGGGDSKV